MSEFDKFTLIAARILKDSLRRGAPAGASSSLMGRIGATERAINAFLAERTPASLRTASASFAKLPALVRLQAVRGSLSSAKAISASRRPALLDTVNGKARREEPVPPMIRSPARS
jgi:hypothetical protein